MPTPSVPDAPSPARVLWWRLEHLHAVTYFDAGCREANAGAGLRGFWMGYFASRAAPLGPVGPGVVEALFFNFAPAMVRRALPDAWGFCPPAVVLDVRRRAAAAALRRLVPGIDEAAERARPLLEAAVAGAPGSGRTLFCANRDVAPDDDPVASLWQLATALREHRGDGHVAVLTAEGLTGAEPHLLAAGADRGRSEMVRSSRGWSEEDWEAAADRLRRRGLLDGDGAPTGAGLDLRARVEQATDELASAAYDTIGHGATAELTRLLAAPAAAVSSSGVIPYPNPIGLPPPG